MTKRVLVVGTDGTIRSIYDDAISGGVLTEVGRLHVTRASSVEFDDDRQMWVARTESGEVIAEGPTRGGVIEDEVRALERRL